MIRRSFCASGIGALASAAKRKWGGIDGLSLGNGTAFSAVAPSQRPVCDAHQSKVFGSGAPIMSPRARTPGRLTSDGLVSSARTAASVSPMRISLAVLPVCYIPPPKSPDRFDDSWMQNNAQARSVGEQDFPEPDYAATLTLGSIFFEIEVAAAIYFGCCRLSFRTACS